MSASLALALAVVPAIALSFALDAIAVPRAPLARPLLSSMLHILSVGFLAGLAFALTSRPIFSACAALALVGLVAAVSNAKYESLREPFVFTDLSLFSQLFAHPRLYLPFLSAGKVVAIGAGIVLVIAGFVAERPLPPAAAAPLWLAVGLSFALAVAIAARLPLTLEPSIDQRRHGFFAVFVAYLLNGLRPATFRRFRECLAGSPFATGEPVLCPDVVLIQSESFFDARRLGAAIESGLLRCFDQARGEAVWHGEMTVPAWGANTMRTEFAVFDGHRLAVARLRAFLSLRLRQAAARLAGRLVSAVAVTRQSRSIPITPISSDETGYFPCSVSSVSSTSVISPRHRAPALTWRTRQSARRSLRNWRRRGRTDRVSCSP